MVLRAPRSALFPYTTLFRSVKAAAVVGGDPCEGWPCPASWVFICCTRLIRSSSTCSTLTLSEPSQVDRKSTRLNSSHVKISYAVFCLKKKKKARKDTVNTKD